MEFAEELRLKEDAIRQRWFEKILDSYPPNSRVFYRTKKDGFLNPVGTILSDRAGAILESLIRGFNRQELTRLLEDVIKIRAVQDFSPSEAVSFLQLLKSAVREELGIERGAGTWWQEIGEFEERIDWMTLLAFDIYTGCRQRIYELRIEELKRLQGTPRSRRAAEVSLKESEQEPGEAGGYQ